MFEEILEKLYKLKAGDLSSKYQIITYLDDAVAACKTENVAFLPRREFLSLICIYHLRTTLIKYDRITIGTYEFRKKIDAIKDMLGLHNDIFSYKTVSISKAEELKDMIEIGLCSANDEIKDTLEEINGVFFEE